MWGSSFSISSFADFFKALAVSLVINLDGFVFRRQTQPVGEAVHVGEIAALQQHFQSALWLEFFDQSVVIGFGQLLKLGIADAVNVARQQIGVTNRSVFAGRQRGE